ncbi:MAG: tyrosine-type recombinase/integrase [Acidimicrobiia bacterium]
MIGHTKVAGPLALLADGFRKELDRLGYTPSSREYKVAEVARLSAWLESRGLGVGDICSARLEEFLADLAARGGRAPTLVAMRPLLDWLRERELIWADPAPIPGPLDELMARYRHWMATDRQLAPRTIGRYEQGARLFLAGRARQGGDAVGVEGLSEEAVTAFLLAEASRGLSSKSLQGRVAELRSLLRFFYLQAMISTPLAEGVPPVPGWKDTGVPRRLAATEVQVLLDSCDRATASGKRDFAVLLLLARMGLRAAEVAGLELDNFDWRVGELVVHGKAGRCDRMPLPNEVGEAVAAYLLEARPQVESRTAFVTLVAPPRPMGHTAVGQMVWRQCRVAGLEPVRAHRLRHALATELLAQGVKLPAIAQVLRQRDLATTAIYAKVDYPALRELALPWLVVR